MGKIYINCSRCGKDLECEELDDVYTSRIDDSFLCKDCYEKEKPDYIQQLKQQYENEIKELENSQTQLAIQTLEQVKELLTAESKRYPIVYDITDDLVGGAIDMDKTFEIIDNQIKILENL